MDLFFENEGLVKFVIKKFNFIPFPPFDYHDLVSSGRIGLWQACMTYDSQRGRFSSYATKCIKNSILMEIYRKPSLFMLSLDAPTSDQSKQFDTYERCCKETISIEENFEVKETIKYIKKMFPIIFAIRILNIKKKEIKQARYKQELEAFNKYKLRINIRNKETK